MYWQTVDTPAGRLLIVKASKVVRIDWIEPDTDPQQLMFERYGSQQRATRECAAESTQLERFVSGQTQQLEMDLDWSQVRPWTAQVLAASQRIPYGQHRSYGQLAAETGSAAAARAVGQAMRNNPWSLVVPCHRVRPASGKLGNYNSGSWRKQWLFELESKL